MWRTDDAQCERIFRHDVGAEFFRASEFGRAIEALKARAHGAASRDVRHGDARRIAVCL